MLNMLGKIATNATDWFSYISQKIVDDSIQKVSLANYLISTQMAQGVLFVKYNN